MIFKRLSISLSLMLLAAVQSNAAFLRVNQSGSDFLGTAYTTIQAAVDACTPAVGCDEILITDTEVYEEQVTFDGKGNIKLHSIDPSNPATIRYTDKEGVNPKTFNDTKTAPMDGFEDARTLYDMNGALRILFSSDIEVYDLNIDGGERYYYAYPGIWEAKFPLNSGNVGVMVRNSNKVHVHHTKIYNAWYGIYLKGRNLGGQNANPNPADNDTQDNIPISDYGTAGRGLYEYNKIYDNSFAFFGESEWDLGSTIRYNLIHSNYARSGDYGSYSGVQDTEREAGGFMKVKDVTLAIYQIYNNTFWNNHYNMASVWKAGIQHVLFNNIWAKPNSPGDDTWYEFADILPNHSYSVSEYMNKQALTSQSVNNGNIGGSWVNFDTPLEVYYNYDLQAGGTGSPWESGSFQKGGTMTVMAGGVASEYTYTDFFIPPVKSIAGENWWYEDIAWQSTTPGDPKFLCPDWEILDVQQTMLNKGRTDTGLKDADGSAPDVGALSKGDLNDCVFGGSPSAPSIDLIGTSPALKAGNQALINFAVDVNNAELTNLSNVKFHVINHYSDVPVVEGDAQTPTGNFPAAQTISYTGSLKAGANTVYLDVDLGAASYSTIEVIVSGDINGVPYFSNQEMFQYRGASTGGDNVVSRQYNLKIHFENLSGTKIDSIRAGEALRVVTSVVDFDGTVQAAAKATINDVRTSTFIGNKINATVWDLATPNYADWASATKTGNPKFTNIAALEAGNVAFSAAGSETLCLAGIEGADKSKVVFGCAGITVLPGAAWTMSLLTPESSKGKDGHLAAVGKGTANILIQLLDQFGNPALNDPDVAISLTSDNQAVAVNPTQNGKGSNDKGQMIIQMDVIGDLGTTFKLTANFASTGNSGISDFSNVEVATPPLGIQVKPDANGDVAPIKQPSGTCVPLDMAAIDEDNNIVESSMEFYIEATGGPIIYRDESCEISISPTEALSTSDKGEIMLYISGVDVTSGAFQTKLKQNLLAKTSFPESIVFFSPEVYFVDSLGTKIPDDQMGIEEYMFVSFPLSIGSFFEGLPCTTCNNFVDFDIDTTRFIITDKDGNPIDRVALVGGVAEVYAYGISEFTDGAITVKSGSKLHTYTPIEIEESPVPYIINNGANMYDTNGDGIGDSLTLQFNRPFSPDTASGGITFRWPNGENAELSYDSSKISAGIDFISITPADLTPSDVTGQLSDDVNTVGPGAVKVYWPKDIIQTGYINQRITDKMGAIIVDAQIVLTDIWDELTLRFSEPLLADSINPAGLLFEFRRDGEIHKFVPATANWADSNRALVWRFAENDSVSIKAQSGDSVRIYVDPAVAGLIVDESGNASSPTNVWAEIVGLKRVRIEYDPFFQGPIPDVDPKDLINKSFEIKTVSNNSDVAELTLAEGNQGFFIPFAFFEGGSDPDAITIDIEVYVYTSLGGYVTNISKRFSCNDTQIFDRNCLSDRKALWVGWKYRDINGRKVGSGIYLFNYKFFKKDTASKINSTQEKVIDMGYHRVP